MANNKKELTELLNAIGMTAEMALNFFSSNLGGWRHHSGGVGVDTGFYGRFDIRQAQG